MFKVITVLSLSFLIMGVQGFAGFKFSDDPGIVVAIRETVVEKLMQTYFDQAAEAIKEFEIDDTIKEKNMKIHGIRGELQNLDKNNIEIKFNPKINGLSVVVKDPKIILRSKVEVKKVIKIKGNIKATGKFKSISMDISFIRGLTDWQYIPNVEVKNMDVNMNDKDFKVVFECHKCLKDVKNFVIKLFRKEITKKQTRLSCTHAKL
ncbi:unnamed protein product [Moneuplotes crassus]|uniref:Uncharacterized protein n=1 Tax=Euplotes crassus TaxID=5936 RepID=A0AAD1UNI1_EUPCR|nr:unnamed protein product [Moneuplotes crassus]